MADSKKTQTHAEESQMGSRTSEMLSQQRRTKEKSKQKQYHMEDKRKVAREEHTNGSTPKSRL